MEFWNIQGRYLGRKVFLCCIEKQLVLIPGLVEQTIFALTICLTLLLLNWYELKFLGWPLSCFLNYHSFNLWALHRVRVLLWREHRDLLFKTNCRCLLLLGRRIILSVACCAYPWWNVILLFYWRSCRAEKATSLRYITIYGLKMKKVLNWLFHFEEFLFCKLIIVISSRIIHV